MPVLLKNATYIDWQSLEFSHVNIKVEDGPEGGISFVESEFNDDKCSVIDCSGKYVTKSFAVGHHHAYSALARGMGAPAKSPANFYEILKYIWWTLDKALDRNIIEASALATAISCAKAGATFVIDHHASPNSIKGSLEIIARAFERVGVQHLLCYEVSDRDGKAKSVEGLFETERYLTDKQGLIGLHASFTLGKETLIEAGRMMERTASGVHIHVAEDKFDQEYCIENYNKRVVERLHERGFLKSHKTILAHCLHINDNERALIRTSNAWVVQNTESNQNNNVGHFNAKGLGDRIMMGTDGMHSDMLRSAQSAYFAGQEFDVIDPKTTYQRFRNVHHYISENGFSGDGDNNLIVLDYDSPTEFSQENFYGHFIYGLNTGHIRDVISEGRLIVKDRKVCNIDENEVLTYTKEQAGRLWARMKK